MKQYLLSIYQPDGDPPPPAELDAIMRDVAAFEDELRSAGAWVFSGGLHDAATATVVRPGGQDFLVWASHLGADATLPKPFRTSQLIEVARALLERRGPPAEPSPFAREDGFGRERFQSERAA